MKNIGKPCAGKPHARFDEGGLVETVMERLFRHRQTKEVATDKLNLKLRDLLSTLPSFPLVFISLKSLKTLNLHHFSKKYYTKKLEVRVQIILLQVMTLNIWRNLRKAYILIVLNDTCWLRLIITKTQERILLFWKISISLNLLEMQKLNFMGA